MAIGAGLAATSPAHTFCSDSARHRGTRHHPPILVVALALAAGLTHLPFLAAPLGSDEGGLLMVAAQWAPGTSLYGDYWVDRPPLLIAFFGLADRLGGTTALRLLGIGTVLVSVLAAGRIGHLLSASSASDLPAPRRGVATAAAATAAVFLASPIFGTREVNGELISVAAILAAMAVGLAAARRPGHSRVLALALAGALATAAVLVKQNQLDGLIFLTGLIAAVAANTPRSGRRQRLRSDLGSIALGATVAGLLVIGAAAVQETSPLALWDAMVTFRIDASRVIGTSATSATGDRARGLLGALAFSGAPLLILHLVGRLARVDRSSSSVGRDLRWVAAAVLIWESISVIGGGSYWRHYLICLVPGLVLAVSVASSTRLPDRMRRSPSLRIIGSPHTALAYCAGVTAISLASAFAGPSAGSTADPTSTWLHARADPGDTAVVAYGQPDILRNAGLESPYPYLWSLIVRVRDPDLSRLTATLASSRRPDWIITGSGGLHGWGIDPTTGDSQLVKNYRPVATVDGHVVYRQRTRRTP